MKENIKNNFAKAVCFPFPLLFLFSPPINEKIYSFTLLPRVSDKTTNLVYNVNKLCCKMKQKKSLYFYEITVGLRGKKTISKEIIKIYKFVFFSFLFFFPLLVDS